MRPRANMYAPFMRENRGNMYVRETRAEQETSAQAWEEDAASLCRYTGTPWATC